MKMEGGVWSGRDLDHQGGLDCDVCLFSFSSPFSLSFSPCFVSFPTIIIIIIHHITSWPICAH